MHLRTWLAILLGAGILVACVPPTNTPAPRAVICVWGDSVMELTVPALRTDLAADNLAVHAVTHWGYGLTELPTFYEPAVTADPYTCAVNVTDLGNNDLDPADAVQADVQGYVDRWIGDLGPAPLIWLTPPSSGPWDPTRIATFDQTVRTEMAGHAGTVVQASTLLDPADYQADQVHPTVDGATKLASALHDLVVAQLPAG